MGLYDREYGRPDDTSWQPGIHLGGARTLTTNLVLITAGVYVVQLLRLDLQKAGLLSIFCTLWRYARKDLG